MKQTQWHSSKGNSCRQMTLTKQKLLLEILYTLYVATKTSRIPRKAKRIFLGGNFLLRISEYTQRERKCSFRKLQISISQTTDFHFHFVSFHFVSQTTVSLFVATSYRRSSHYVIECVSPWVVQSSDCVRNIYRQYFEVSVLYDFRLDETLLRRR